MNIAAHHSMIGGKTLPYIPVNGIYSDGTAYCTLAHVHTNATAGKIEFIFKNTAAIQVSDINGKNCCGDSTRDGYHLLNNYITAPDTTAKTIYFQIYCGGTSWVQLALPYASGRPVLVSATRSGSSLSMISRYADTFEVIGEAATTVVRNMTLGRLGIFTQNNAGAGSGVSPISSRVPKNLAMLSFRYWDGNNIIADLQPCQRKETGEYCFYNSVDKTFVANIANGGRFLPLP